MRFWVGKISLLLAANFIGGCVTGSIEEPKYQVLDSEEEFELRQYESRIEAETFVQGSFDEAPSDGFRILADYIFGNNISQDKISMTAPVGQQKRSEKIAMTAPVAQQKAGEKSGDQQWRITFTMPRSYTMDDLPKPVDKRVVLKEIPAEKLAVVRFSGLNKEDKVKEKTAALRRWLQEKKLEEKQDSTPIYARYNPPWTPWFLRRHEILIPVR